MRSTFPVADVQLCVVHQIPNATKFVSYKDRKAFCADMRPIYTAPHDRRAELALERFAQAWGARYPMAAESWRRYWEGLIRPRWADTPLAAMKSLAVEDWLKGLALALKTKSHIRSLMHTIFHCARHWELVQRNPIELVRVRGGSKRLRTPRVLTPEAFCMIPPSSQSPIALRSDGVFTRPRPSRSGIAGRPPET